MLIKSASLKANLMSNDPADETSVSLRAKAAHCVSIAKFMSEDTRARLIQMASDCLERAGVLEKESHGRDK